jgi:hypothetical protein
MTSADNRRPRTKKRWADFKLAIASGETIRNAAARLGIGESCAYKKANEPDFATAVERIRSELFSTALAKLTANMAKAADRLGALIESSDGAIACRAAIGLLKVRSDLRQSVEFEERLAALEAAQYEAAKPAVISNGVLTNGRH